MTSEPARHTDKHCALHKCKQPDSNQFANIADQLLWEHDIQKALGKNTELLFHVCNECYANLQQFEHAGRSDLSRASPCTDCCFGQMLPICEAYKVTEKKHVASNIFGMVVQSLVYRNIVRLPEQSNTDAKTQTPQGLCIEAKSAPKLWNALKPLLSLCLEEKKGTKHVLIGLKCAVNMILRILGHQNSYQALLGTSLPS